MVKAGIANAGHPPKFSAKSLFARPLNLLIQLVEIHAEGEKRRAEKT